MADLHYEKCHFPLISCQRENLNIELKFGVIVKLKKVPFKVKLFKLVAKNGDIDWLITNELDDTLGG